MEWLSGGKLEILKLKPQSEKMLRNQRLRSAILGHHPLV
jgi:hypothetical protein